MKFYKYLTFQVACLLYYKNSIRIGTLEGFRDMEAKRGYSDPLEGSYTDRLFLDYFNEHDYRNNPTLRKNVSRAFGIGSACSNIVFSNNTITTHRRSKNYLIFCCAHKLSTSVMNEFEDANTCYHIHNVNSFFNLITWELEKNFKCAVDFKGIFQVNYDDYERQRFGISSEPISPALVKVKDFEKQCEIRAIWEVPEELLTEPFYDLNVLGLRKFCRFIEL